MTDITPDTVQFESIRPRWAQRWTPQIHVFPLAVLVAALVLAVPVGVFAFEVVSTILDWGQSLLQELASSLRSWVAWLRY